MMTKKNKKKSRGLFRFIRIVVLLVIVVMAGFVGFYLIYPDVTFLKKVNPKKTSFMEYREDQWKVKGKKAADTKEVGKFVSGITLPD